MMNQQVQEAIVKNIMEFNSDEAEEFIKRLVEVGIYMYDGKLNTDDLVDMIKVKSVEDYWKLDTSVRDRYIDSFLRMHIGIGVDE